MDLSFDSASPLSVTALIFACRVVDVSLGTLRISLVARGSKGWAPLVGFFEVMVWLVGVSQALLHLDSPLNYVAFAGGYAAGTWVGLLAEDLLAMGLYSVRIVTADDAGALIQRLGDARFGLTTFAARGIKERVRLIITVIRRRELDRLLGLVSEEQPNAFVSVSDVRLAREGHIPPAGAAYRRLGEMLRKK